MSLDTLRLTLTTAQSTRAQLDTDLAARVTTWERDRTTNGREPLVNPVPAEPTKPTDDRPDEATVTAARALVDGYPAAKALHDRHVQQLAGYRADATTAAATATKATAEATRITTLLGHARAAPSRVLAPRIAALHLPEHIEITVPDYAPRSPVIEVRAFGSPWFEASTGQRVVAGMAFRGCLRAAVAEQPATKSARYLSIFVDDMVSYNGGAGPWPELAGVVFLRTTDEPGVGAM